MSAHPARIRSEIISKVTGWRISAMLVPDRASLYHKSCTKVFAPQHVSMLSGSCCCTATSARGCSDVSFGSIFVAQQHKGARRIPLNSASMVILKRLRPQVSGYAFPSAASLEKHMTGIQKTWKRVSVEAKLGNMRLHDLRHSFASFAIANGENIVVIANVLGHASTRMTERYLHLRDDQLSALSERTGQLILRRSLC